MLLITAGFVTLGFISKDYQFFIRAHPEVAVLMIIVYFTTLCALMCCGYAKKVPINYILLLIMTLAQSYTL